MSSTQPITSLTAQLEGTTVDQEKLTAYLSYNSTALEAGIAQGLSRDVLRCLHYSDEVSFCLRHYLSGHSSTLRNLFRQIRLFLAYDEETCRLLVLFIIEAARARLLNNEWYELMQRFDKASKRIYQTFRI